MTDRGAQWAVAEQWLAPAIQVVGITSADKYYAWLRTSDQPVTRAVAREVWGETLRAEKYASVMEQWPSNRLLPRSWITQSESANLRGFGYKFRATTIDPETGLEMEQTFMPQTGLQYTYDQALNLAKANIEAGSPPIEGELTDLTLVAVYHKVGDSW